MADLVYGGGLDNLLKSFGQDSNAMKGLSSSIAGLDDLSANADSLDGDPGAAGGAPSENWGRSAEGRRAERSMLSELMGSASPKIDIPKILAQVSPASWRAMPFKGYADGGGVATVPSAYHRPYNSQRRADGGGIFPQLLMALATLNRGQKPGQPQPGQMGQAGQQPQMPSALPGPESGGLVVGPGDGRSDSVPMQKKDGGALDLSVDEYVLPADYVSALGNGSSAAGARKLDAHVAHVRKNYREKLGALPGPHR